ncbi:hypothetical protein SAVERM_3710 [Streptomyces avermitilis MA-4680 = NBRC 14893]|uniref:Uncharacterized protein n=1 Tax=Streptomyces avermitilis (strain ATCC 31267 / DSM 46492 / JCM 5070 / NBRC 14893 / NCIMB 12804 / NRRL 8165 / MA-4680) TaxID=227882 RepID=Q82H36_STRAW|nr:hypothetical protein SAVERM_3710 [Streptomyces avermitilis MA-4680 = NBRC 14893]
MEAGKRHLNCENVHDADGGVCVICVICVMGCVAGDVPMTHLRAAASHKTAAQKPE